MTRRPRRGSAGRLHQGVGQSPQAPPSLGPGQPQDTRSVSCSLPESWARLQRPALPRSLHAHTLQKGPIGPELQQASKREAGAAVGRPGHSCVGLGLIWRLAALLPHSWSHLTLPRTPGPSCPQSHLNTLGASTKLPSVAGAGDASRDPNALFLLVLLVTGSILPRALLACRPFQGILLSLVALFPDSSSILSSVNLVILTRLCDILTSFWRLPAHCFRS